MKIKNCAIFNQDITVVNISNSIATNRQVVSGKSVVLQNSHHIAKDAELTFAFC